MGYTTDFSGSLSIEPPLSSKEIDYLRAFSNTRRMNRSKGPFFVGDTDSGVLFGESKSGAAHNDVIDHNQPPEGQPGLWCQWTCNDEGPELFGDGGEKFYYADAWRAYLNTYFLTHCAAAVLEPETMGFLKLHRLSGEIFAVREDTESDIWKLKADEGGIHISCGTWSTKAMKEVFKHSTEDESESDYLSAEAALVEVRNPGMVNWGPWDKVRDFANPDEEARVMALAEKDILDSAASAGSVSADARSFL